MWLQDRGFGFLTDGNGGDVFVHANQLPEEVRRRGGALLAEGQQVMFHRLEDQRGPKAYDVTFCGDPEILTAEDFTAELLASNGPGIQPYAHDTLEMARRHGWVR